MDDDYTCSDTWPFGHPMESALAGFSALDRPPVADLIREYGPEVVRSEVPTDEYGAEVVDVLRRFSRTGDPVIIIVFQIKNGSHVGCEVALTITPLTWSSIFLHLGLPLRRWKQLARGAPLWPADLEAAVGAYAVVLVERDDTLGSVVRDADGTVIRPGPR